MTSELHKSRLVLVTGPAGAGRTTAIKVLEDLNFEVIDNLPLAFWPRLLDGPQLDQSMALGIDTRNRDFSATGLLDQLDKLVERSGLEVSMLYLDCRADIPFQSQLRTRSKPP